tara:strand:+ start:834 stop:1088 length:255 start_codon:yes stop_codon:yes gene_type:complete
MTKMINEKVANMVEMIAELQEDSTIPRNVKNKLEFCSNALQEDIEISLRVDKAKHAIEEVSEDSNLEAYTRTQLWNIASELEKL